MPLYEYHCSHCGSSNDEYMSLDNIKSTIICPDCGQLSNRIYLTPAIRFIGPGFYNNDYKNNKNRDKENKSESNPKSDLKTNNNAKQS